MSRIRVQKPLTQLLKDVLSDDVLRDNFLTLMGKYQANDSQGRYLHWNDFQWRVEKGDPELVAWVATKMARKAIAKNLPLLQAEGDRYFNYCVPDSLFAQLHRIDKLTGGGRQISEGEVLSSLDKNRYLVKSGSVSYVVKTYLCQP